MKKYKVHVEAPVVFTYDYEVSEEDMCGMALEPDPIYEADNLYHYWRDEVGALIEKNIKITIIEEEA